MLRLIVLLVLVVYTLGFTNNVLKVRRNIIVNNMSNLQYDSQGYLIKPRDWFNGLSTDPGGSLTDPRAVPPVMKSFAEKIKNGGEVSNFAETLKLIDEHYTYFAVPFTCGDLKSPANTNTGSAKVFSFGLMTKMDEKATLR